MVCWTSTKENFLDHLHLQKLKKKKENCHYLKNFIKSFQWCIGWRVCDVKQRRYKL